MRTKLTKREVEAIDKIDSRLCKIAEAMDENDVALHYGNGTCATQLNCAIAALETILQEYLV